MPGRRFVDTKIRALLCHRSQWRSTMGIDTDGLVEGETPEQNTQLEGFVGRVRGEAEATGRGAGIGPAEGFKLLDKV